VKRLPQGYEEMYFQYSLYIEDDVWAGHFEGGTKLPGIRYTPVANASGLFGDRAEHTGRSLANPGLWGLVDYSFTAQTLPGFPPSPETNYVHVPRNIVLKAGRWYVVEHRSKMNTPGAKDGIRSIWINGHRVFHTEDYNFRGDDDAAKWNELNVNVYHGGMGFPASPMHYRIAKIRASTRYIGVPREFSR
jgi:hypothetical protein